MNPIISKTIILKQCYPYARQTKHFSVGILEIRMVVATNIMLKYRHLKEKEYNLFNDESEEEEINIYLNPHCEYDSNSHPANGK